MSHDNHKPFDGKPQEIDPIFMAFPATVVGTLLPNWDDIPKEFRDRGQEGTEWGRLVHDWFFNGLNGHFVPKDGVSAQLAGRHLQACMGSYQPGHEHKMAGVAYLCSLWFERYEENKDAQKSKPRQADEKSP